MDYVKVAKTTDFSDTRHKIVKLLGRLVGIIKRDDGSFFAVEASCKHQGADLLVGYSGGTVVSCHRHQWKYNLETGECLNRKSLPLRRYDLKIENNQILVSLVPISSEESVDFLASNYESK